MYNQTVVVDSVSALCRVKQHTMPIVTKEGFLLPPEIILFFPAEVTVAEGSKVVIGSDTKVVNMIKDIRNAIGLVIEKEVHCIV